MVPDHAIERQRLHLRNMVYDLIVAGGGAAGFFAAIQAAEMKTAVKILILEKSTKLLSKVKVSGGGRCNVTHHCHEVRELAGHYPRGEKSLRSIFRHYDAKKVIEWFNRHGVELKVEEDGRMFPTTDDSQTIIDCFMRRAIDHGIEIKMAEEITEVSRRENFEVTTASGSVFKSKNLLIATGGSPKQEAYGFIQRLGHAIKEPIPSLFTFNDKEKHFAELMGVSVPFAEVKIAGSKFVNAGALLITHWGLSGPAVIKLSAWAAEYLFSLHYNFTALVSWIGPYREEEVKKYLLDYKLTKGKQKVLNNPLYGLPQRLWARLCAMAEIADEKIWAELPQKNINRLMEFMIRCPFNIKGKTTFKEEFVTCGGVDLKQINVDTMESKLVPGLFFAGEVIDVDGETGGFNFQAAWSTAYVAAKSLNH